MTKLITGWTGSTGFLPLITEPIHIERKISSFMEQTLIDLMQELDSEKTTDRRRLQIGEWFEKNGDPRPGAGMKEGVPD